MHLRGGSARLQAAHHLQPPVRGPVHAGALLSGTGTQWTIEREGNADLVPVTDRLLDAGELGREDADDGHRHVVDSDDLSNRLGIAAKTRAPVAGAQHGNRWCGGLIVFRNDRASEHRVHAEHTVVVSGRDERRRDLRLAVHDHAHPAERRARKQVRHRLVVGDELFEHRIREGRSDVASGLVGAREAVVARARHHVVLAAPAQSNEGVGIPNRQGLDEEAVDGTEESRVCADPQCQRQDNYRRPALGLEQHAEALTQISDHGG